VSTFTGTTVIVTGAANGIGRATAELFHGLGAGVVALDLDPAVADGPGTAVVGDVTDPDVQQAAVDTASALDGRLGVLVNCAFSEERAPLTEGTAEGWAATQAVSLTAPVDLSRRFVAALDGPASIVNVASVHAFGAVSGFGAYAAAKAGLLAFTRTAAVEWGPRGIRVNAVAPGFVAVERNAHLWGDEQALAKIVSRYPLGRVSHPEEVARCIAFLAGPDASFVTGAVLPVDGGLLARLPEGERP
jgi:NAD(P)-dependent dehydrogenase (short-subunit alcohol dehydrogenase family)